MTHAFKAHFEKVLVTLAAGLFAGSGYWIWLQQTETRRVRQQAVAAALTGEVYAKLAVQAPDAAAPNWAKAPAQSHGSGWLYEVFTPPVIYYNTIARSFTVTPPRFGNEGADLQFGLELLAVKLEPFRLQLVGYFGSTGDYLAAFVSPNQPETLLARAGKRFDALGLTLQSFDVKKVVVAHDDKWPVYDVAGLAVLRDEATGAEVVLDTRAEKFTDTPLAVLKLLTGDGQPRELREGDTFSDDSATYRIERVQLEPAEVVVARLTPGLPVPETKVLHPVTDATSTAQAANRRPGPSQPLSAPSSAKGLASQHP